MKLVVLFLLTVFTAFSQETVENDWITYFEKSGFVGTPDYNETMTYFQKIADASEYAEFSSFGISPQGRELKYLILTKEELNNRVLSSQLGMRELNKTTVLIVNGIHAGEIEGKDASMLLLREILITKEKEYLLDSINIIVVPIFSVDGHERKSRFNRINQNGPEEMGWRTTAQNLNLNRDWMKADTPEMQAMLKLIHRYFPDFAIDTHTTNGVDHQYDVTYQVETYGNMYFKTADLLKTKFVPYLLNKVEENGFKIFPYVGMRNWESGNDISIYSWASSPRLSTGYFALINCPSLLVETHMIKPYKERVYSTKVVLETTLQFVFENSSYVKQLHSDAYLHTETKLAHSYMPITFSANDEFEEDIFKSYEFYHDSSEISGSQKLVYTDKLKDYPVKHFKNVIPTDSIKYAKGYYIPREYSFLVDRLAVHGIEANIVRDDELISVTRYKFKNVKFAERPYEGRHRVSFDYDTIKEDILVHAGTFYFRVDMMSAHILTTLLEPKSQDSFIQWGFMNQIFEQKEYFEQYVMEKLAEDMMNSDETLKNEFSQKLENDEKFKNNPHERLNFFYKKSPYWDKSLNLYPILRVD